MSSDTFRYRVVAVQGRDVASAPRVPRA